ncbi:uncharacterized protein LOC121369830 [Gigantopelta aegis]|uniref:uncharacterized protein LOC121369830 n=1 Tax=Gigantopelta aegis TaxID=1735272 RepID=UPI001B88B3E2|nr:uncharacterized protein LOC121369830 [Gigantopelta aegis]
MGVSRRIDPTAKHASDVHSYLSDAAGAIFHEGNTIVPPKKTKPEDVPDSIIHRNSGNRDSGIDSRGGDADTKSDIEPIVTVHTSPDTTVDTNNNNNNVRYSDGDDSRPVRNITVVCVNYTTITLGGSKQASMGFMKDWFNTVHFLARNKEKAILYLVLGICAGIITLLSVALTKIGIDYKRNVKAKLDVTEPTHSHNATNNHHHNPLEGPSLEHADSLDRIEVVRFSPRGTLRSDHGNRSLSNYYG